MPDALNPLIPAAYDIAWTAVAVIVLTLMVLALVSIVRVSKNLTTTQSMVWALLAIFVPVLGPLAWFVIGRTAATQPTP